MSLHLPARRALQAAASSTPLRPITAATLCGPLQSLSLGASTTTTTTLQLTQSRTFFGWLRGRKKDERDIAKEVVPPSKEEAEAMRKKLSTPKMGGSIFSDELGGDKDAARDKAATDTDTKLRGGGSKSPLTLARAVDPDPRSRERWQRKMVARLVKRRLDPWDKETRAERIARTERQHVHRSPLLITSTKKLMHIARQVAGKPLNEAAVQMRFSRKKFAREVGVQIDAARDEAVVMAGMGLAPSSSPSAAAAAAADGASEGFKPVKFKNKDGKWITVDDPSRLYIDQAWVNRGPFLFHGFHYSGRGRSHAMWTRTSNINFIVKEEKTRLREHREREAKKARQKPWVHLPNRPVTTQRQHYSW